MPRISGMHRRLRHVVILQKQNRDDPSSGTTRKTTAPMIELNERRRKKKLEKNSPSGTPSLPLVHSVPCAVMSTMVLAVAAEVGGSTPSTQGAACGATGARRRRYCDAKEGGDDDVGDEVEGVEIIDGASRECGRGSSPGQHRCCCCCWAPGSCCCCRCRRHPRPELGSEGGHGCGNRREKRRSKEEKIEKSERAKKERRFFPRFRYLFFDLLFHCLSRFVFPTTVSFFSSTPMSLADLERSLLARLDRSGDLSKLRAGAREAALRELNGLASSSSSLTKPKAKTPPPTPPAETVVALELVREFLDFHGFSKARSLLEAEADLPPCRGSRRGSFFGRRALASLVGVDEEEAEEAENRDELLRPPPPLLYSVMAKAAATSTKKRQNLVD